MRGNQDMFVHALYLNDSLLIKLGLSSTEITNNSVSNSGFFQQRSCSTKASPKFTLAACKRAWQTWKMQDETKQLTNITLSMMQFKIAGKDIRCLVLYVHLGLTISCHLSWFYFEHAASWGSLSSIGKETQEFSYKGLHGQSREI